MYASQCEGAHEKLAAGRCPWCGQAVFHGRAGPPNWQREQRLVRFEFQGGERDGEVVTGQPSGVAPLSPLWILLYFTDGGRLGATFSNPLTRGTLDKVQQAIEQNDWQVAKTLFARTYEVVHREEGPEEISIRLALVDSA